MLTQKPSLPALCTQDSVAIQDQSGNTPRRWSKTGKVVEILGHDSYLIKVDGSNRLTKRNRQFLRRLSPYKCDADDFVPATSPASAQVIPLDAPDPLLDSPNESSNEESAHVSNPRPPQSSCSVPSGVPSESVQIRNPSANECVLPSAPSQVELEASTHEPNLNEPSSVSVVPMDVPSVPDPATKTHRLPSSRPHVKEKWIVNPKFDKPNQTTLTE